MTAAALKKRAAWRLHPADLMRRTLLPLLGFLLLSFSALADSGMWGQRGISRRFAVDGNVLYAADGRGVAVYDVSDAHRVQRLDVEWSDDETNDLALMGESDLVVGTSAGVERFGRTAAGTIDRLGATTATGPVSRIAANATYAAAASDRTITILERDPSGGLSVVRRIFFSNPVTAVAVVGDYLYAAVDREPLSVFALPNPTPVRLLSGVNASDLAFSSGVLWAVSTNDGLTAIDVANPASPAILGTTGRNEIRPTGVAATGTRVYAFEAPDVLYVFDATDAAAPQLRTTLHEWVNVLAASDTRLFLAGAMTEESGLAYDPGLIPRETGRPVRVFDATNLAAPALTAEYEDLAGPVSGVWTDGSVAYVIDPPYLRVLDVSVTASPREVTRLQIDRLQDRIRVKNGLAVLYGRAYVNLLDVSVPLRPRYLGTWNAQGHPPSAAGILRDRILEANEHSGMHVVDFSDPSRPVQIGGRKWHYRDVAVSDDAVYAIQSDLVLVVEVRDQRTVVDQDFLWIKPRQLDTVPPNSASPDLLLTGGADGLHLFDIRGDIRFHPHELEFFPASGLGVFGTTASGAYIDRGGRLQFIDLTLPTIALQETNMRVTHPMQISAAGQKVVVADRYSVRVFGPDTAPPQPLPVRRRTSRH